MDTFMRQFRELIKKMLIELSPNNIFLREILQEQRDRALAIQATEAMQLIRELQDSLYKVEYSDHWHLLRILIAFCYCRLNDVHTSRLWAEDAVRILNATNREGNLALAYWLLAAIYTKEGYFKDSREQYVNAQKTFHQILNNAPNSNVGYRIKKECGKRIRQINRRIASVSQDRSRLLDSARKDQKVNIGTENHDTTAEQTSERSSASNVLIAPINVNVHVPIDNRFADHIDQKSLQYRPLHNDQLSEQEQGPMPDTRIPSVNDFTNTTKQPSYSTPSSADDHKTADINNESPIPIHISDFAYLLTPGPPIYGKASAGPDGHVSLDDPDYDGAIDQSATVRIKGDEYELHALKQDDNQISISHDDFYKSVTSSNVAREFRGKRYGWLKVTGNSMNRVKPVNIEDGDYVLFFENDNIRACIGKIVIVSESMPDSGPVRLLVKRLVRENNQLFLRSYSRDKNPETGREFQDLVFDDCYQLIGEVIVVAKPRPIQES